MKTIIIALIIGLTLSASAFAYGQYANWTGRSERVTTLNYQSALNCEYMLPDGRKFWQTFEYSCPQFVQI